MSGPLREAGKRARSWCRVAIRTAKPLACRWRTMRRPRNPVPPNTVTTCPGTRRTYAVAGPYAIAFQPAYLVRLCAHPGGNEAPLRFPLSGYPCLRASSWIQDHSEGIFVGYRRSFSNNSLQTCIKNRSAGGGGRDSNPRSPAKRTTVFEF